MMRNQFQDRGWAATHRPYFITRLYGDFHALLQEFRRLYAAYLDGRPPSFQAMSTFVGNEDDRGGLWRLKELCHHLWRQNDTGDLEGTLLDWTIGSLFHEAMKLKENIYLRENYLPVIQRALAQDRPTILGMECRRFTERTETEIARQMDTVGFLFGQANVLLRIMLAGQSTNPLLLRFLAEHESIADDLWQEPLAEVFAELFDGRPEIGYCAAGAGFARGNWFARAVTAYEKALALNPECEEARRHLSQLRALARAAGEHPG